MNSNTPILLGLTASLLVHLGFGVLLSQPPQRALPPVFTVRLVPEPPLPTTQTEQPQIVTEPESPEESPTVPTRLRAEKDHSTPREQIRRGDGGGGAGGSSGSPARKLTQLKLDTETVRRTFAGPQRPDSERSRVDPSSVRPFSRPQGSGAAFLGLAGSSDLLPNLPDGDITMLNAKANRFAVFVRRVATQVFGQLRASGWETVRAEDLLRIERFTTVLATLSPQGDLLETKIEESSGSAHFDDLVLSAVRKGARDPNPPAAAQADDGKIQFIFRSRSWVRQIPGGRNGAPREQRWVLLGTGLE